MADENNQESTPQEKTVEQAEPVKEDIKESLDDVLKETITEQPKEIDAKTETSKTKEVETQPKEDKQSSETETVKTDSLLPKDNFTAEEKEYFNSLDDNGKKTMLKKWGNLESGYNKKYESIANQRKTLDEFTETFKPYEQTLALQGITPMQYTKQLITADKFIRENPEEGIKWLAQQSGVDLTKLNQTPENQDPTTQELNLLKGEIGNLKQEISQRELGTIAKQIEDFKNTKDAGGNLKYPHFESVKLEMAKLNTATGENNLEVLYNKSLRLNDDLYQKQLDAEVAKRQAETQKQADLTKAKKVGRPIKSSLNAQVAKKENLDLDTILQEELGR